MKPKKSLISVILLLTIFSVQGVYGSDFKVDELSKQGQEAYNQLLSTMEFSIGLVGWGGAQAPAEKALRILLLEKKAKDALISLIHNASPEGSLYGLFGLKMNNLKTFNRKLKYYKAMPEPPERPRFPNRKVSRQFVLSGFDKIKAGKVLVLRGCILTDKRWQEVISLIESGYYDNEFRLNKPGIDGTSYILIK